LDADWVTDWVVDLDADWGSVSDSDSDSLTVAMNPGWVMFVTTGERVSKSLEETDNDAISVASFSFSSSIFK
jgi:hypothetical protein